MTTLASTSRCTAQLDDGSFCDLPSVSAAPFPICVRHLIEAVGLAEQVFANDPLVHVKRGVGASASECIVYYLQIGEYIKIGWTTKPREQAGQLPTRNPTPGLRTRRC